METDYGKYSYRKIIRDMALNPYTNLPFTGLLSMHAWAAATFGSKKILEQYLFNTFKVYTRSTVLHIWFRDFLK